MAIYMKDALGIWQREYDAHCRTKSPKYSEETLYEAFCKSARKYPEKTAVDFLGAKISYKKLLTHIDICADILIKDGIRPGDAVSICLPNIPQTIIAFYAINKVGARASMIHPLSSPAEVQGFLTQSESKALFTLDLLYPRLMPIVKQTHTKKIYIAKIQEYLPPIKRIALTAANAKKPHTRSGGGNIRMWQDILKTGTADDNYVKKISHTDPAAILYSGGTSSGLPKGILLSSHNFNVLGENLIAFVPEFTPGTAMLTILPLFHGFGLGICVHAILRGGAKIVLVPQFSSDGFINAIRQKRPDFIAGVPSMYAALMSNSKARAIDYSFVKGAFCGGDVVSPELKKRFDKFMGEHNGNVTLREGYGLTEIVTACAISTEHGTPFGSFGIPMPGVLMKIVEPGTQKELPSGCEGELCVSGEAVMIGYLNSPEENAHSLQIHEDGRRWLHTGDMCVMDDKGFFYFKQRIKRIIKVAGFPVYPSSIEETIMQLDFVESCAVIALPDDRVGQKIRAYVVLKEQKDTPLELTSKIKDHCHEYLNKWSMPRQIVFRDSLPLTRVGKINIPALEKEAAEETQQKSK